MIHGIQADITIIMKLQNIWKVLVVSVFEKVRALYLEKIRSFFIQLAKMTK